MWEYNHIPPSDELMHYGVLGMKWGVRRSEAQLASSRKRSKSGQDTEDNTSEEYKKARSKSTREMSDAELNSAVRRLQMEKQYRDLNPEKVSAGRKMTDTLLKAAGNVALEAGKQLARDYLVNKGKKMMGLNDEKSDFDKEMDTLGKTVKYTTMKEQYKKNTGNEWSYMKK